MRLFKLFLTVLLLFLATGFTGCSEKSRDINSDQWIKPWENNPFYWQYKGQPVLLLGATDNDNLFQNNNIESHLDSLAAIGGNYIRNTMSDRDDGDHHAYAMNPDGLYDLNRWNDEYWRRFENMLRLTSERDIIVQIEVWDRFDHSTDYWITNPYNPVNNVNYTTAESGLDTIYPVSATRNLQPFFFTVPELNNNLVLLSFQNAFVKKLLSISLEYDNVLYCIDNETTGAEEWATYWADFIRDHAGDKDIYITQMWDPWDVKTDMHKRTLDHPERYRFVDISQNSQLPGRQNWDNPQYVFSYIRDNPRPVNSTKIYGSDHFERWLHRGMTTRHSVQTFYRNILGGFASSRFHRPPAGQGLNNYSINCIKTIRKIEEYVKFWDIVPRMDLLNVKDDNLAYLSAREGEEYVVYFTGVGSVELDLTGFDHLFTVRWIDAGNALWSEPFDINGGTVVELNAVYENGSIALIKRARSQDVI